MKVEGWGKEGGREGRGRKRGRGGKEVGGSYTCHTKDYDSGHLVVHTAGIPWEE